MTDTTGSTVAEIDAPFALCGYKMSVRAPGKSPGKGDLLFYCYVRACHIGQYCPLVCCEYCPGTACQDKTGKYACTTVTMGIYAPDGTHIGDMRRVWQWTKATALAGDAWNVVFPDGFDPVRRAALLAATIVTDYQVFNSCECARVLVSVPMCLLVPVGVAVRGRVCGRVCVHASARAAGAVCARWFNWLTGWLALPPPCPCWCCYVCHHSMCTHACT